MRKYWELCYFFVMMLIKFLKLYMSSLKQACEAGTIAISILQMKKRSYKEVEKNDAKWFPDGSLMWTVWTEFALSTWPTHFSPTPFFSFLQSFHLFSKHFSNRQHKSYTRENQMYCFLVLLLWGCFTHL